MMMEKKLKALFDYQRFEHNEKLEKLIQETESRYAQELSDNDLMLVNAAGEISSNKAPCGCISCNYDNKESCTYYKAVNGHTKCKYV